MKGKAQTKAIIDKCRPQPQARGIIRIESSSEKRNRKNSKTERLAQKPTVVNKPFETSKTFLCRPQQ
jgi:hypothetical protein